MTDYFCLFISLCQACLQSPSFMSWKAEAEEGGGQEENTDTFAFLTAQLERERKGGEGWCRGRLQQIWSLFLLAHALPSLIHSERTSTPVSTGAAGARVLLQVRVNTSILPGSQIRLEKFYKEENLQLQLSFTQEGWMSWKPPSLLPDFRLAQRDITLCHSLCGAPDRSGHSVPWTKTVRLEKAPQDWVTGPCEEEESQAKAAASLHAQLRAMLMPRIFSFPSSCSAWGAAHIPQPAGNTSCAWQAHLEL